MSAPAAARPVVSVYSPEDAKVTGQVALPAVFTAPIRTDIVNFVHTNIRKNSRQAYAVSRLAGHQTSAESWGTGRAVARIPRVQGGGTQRAGQGAFGNMCRGGRMFAPTRVWRKWHHKVNLNQRRFAIASAIAATAVPALVMARGHRIANVAEIPLVIDNQIESVQRTKMAVQILKRFGAYRDVERVIHSKKARAGRGKTRTRKYKLRRGPLIVYRNKDGIERGFRNIPGVSLCNVDRLNLLYLAPGGHVGRFVIWTKDAFEHLNKLYGNYNEKSSLKSDYSLPQNIISNANIARIINSDEVQSVVRPVKYEVVRRRTKKNPLKNIGARIKLNPYAKVVRDMEHKAQEERKNKRAELVKAKRTKQSQKKKAEISKKSARAKKIAEKKKAATKPEGKQH